MLRKGGRIRGRVRRFDFTNAVSKIKSIINIADIIEVLREKEKRVFKNCFLSKESCFKVKKTYGKIKADFTDFKREKKVFGLPNPVEN